jgi:carboxymethylenebutenolidase
MAGRMLSFRGNGAGYLGYLSPAASPAPGVVVVQEWWGLNDHIKDVCDRFGAEGFTALAPDLYNGIVATSPDEAGRLLMALNIAETEKILRGGIAALLEDPACSSETVGVVGFCMGGQLALFAAATSPDLVSACVDFYGAHPSVHPPLENLRAPLLGIFAEMDGSITPDVRAALDRRLTALGKEHEFHTYPGTKHGFFNDTRPIHHPEASRDAWRRTLAFLRQNVK